MTVSRLNANTMKNVAAGPISDTSFVVNTGGTDLCLFIDIAYDSAAGQSITAVSFGGQSCTKVGTTANNASSGAYAECWYLVNPPTGGAGVNTLSITPAGTFGGANDIYYNATPYQGVNQSTPVRLGTYTSATGSSTSPSLVVSSNTADLTKTVLNSGGGAITATNQTSDGTNTGGSYAGGSDHATSAATSVTHTWTQGSSAWAIIGFSINGDPTAITPGQRKAVPHQQRRAA